MSGNTLLFNELYTPIFKKWTDKTIWKVCPSASRHDVSKQRKRYNKYF